MDMICLTDLWISQAGASLRFGQLNGDACAEGSLSCSARQITGLRKARRHSRR